MTIHFRITDVGLAAVKDAAATGANAIVLTRIGAGTGSAAPDGSETDLLNQVAATEFAGAVSNVANECAGSALFTGAGAWRATEAGIWARIGGAAEFLFAYWSTDTAEVGLEKIASQNVRLAVFLRFLSAPDAEITVAAAASITFAGPPATEAVPGIVRWATPAEAAAGVPVDAAMRPGDVKRTSHTVLFNGSQAEGDINLNLGKLFSNYRELSFLLNINFCDFNGSWLGAEEFTIRALQVEEWALGYDLAVTGGEAGKAYIRRVSDTTLRLSSNGCASARLLKVTGID